MTAFCQPLLIEVAMITKRNQQPERKPVIAARQIHHWKPALIFDVRRYAVEVQSFVRQERNHHIGANIRTESPSGRAIADSRAGINPEVILPIVRY